MATSYLEAYPLAAFQSESSMMLPAGQGKADFGLDRLPAPDLALSSKRYCVIALVVSYVLAVAALITSIALLVAKGGVVTTDLKGSVINGVSNIEIAGEIIPLVFNILITACTEAISYIHSVSLRWALYREGRLEFNSNLRLFTSAGSSSVNTPFVNFVSAAALITCYTAASQTIVQGGSGLLLNGVALLMLGIGLLGLCIISSMCLRDSRNRILSWSPNPLNTALTCLHHGIITHRPGRGSEYPILLHYLLPVPGADSNAKILTSISYPKCYRSKKRNFPLRPSLLVDVSPLRTAYRGTRYIVWAQYLLTLLVAGVAVLIFVLVRTLNNVTTFNFLFDENSATGFNVGGASAGYSVWLFCTFLFAAALQTFFVLATHGAELIVNVVRDESAWRAAASGSRNRPGRGAALSSEALGAASQSALWLVLLVFKPLAGWLFTSQGVRFVLRTEDSSIMFNPLPLFALTGMSLFLVILEEWMLRRRVAGPQPVAYGHLQTLTDLIDDWRTSEGLGNRQDVGRLWWGSKGFSDRGSRGSGRAGERTGWDPSTFP